MVTAASMSMSAGEWAWRPVSGVLAAIVCVLVLVVLLIRRRRYVAFYENIPGPKGYPVIGNVLQLLGPQTELFKMYMKYFRDFGDVYVLWVGTSPFVFIGSAEAAQPLLSSSACIEKSAEYKLLEKWLGTGLVTSKGEKWHQRRKLLTPSFHFKLLESFIQPASSCSDVLVQLLRKEVDREEFDVTEYIKLVAVDIIAETAMGYHLNAQLNARCDFIKAINTLSAISQKRFMTPWLKVDSIYNLTSYAKQEDEACNVVHQLRDTIVKGRRETRESSKQESNPKEQGKIRLSLLDFMMENNMSDEDIGEEVDTFMFAGHDTVATVVSWSLFVLAQHKTVQEKILEEFAAVSASTENPFSVGSINKLEYLDRCVKEVMRLYTPVPLIARTANVPLKINDYYLPEGTRILTILHAIHMDPKHHADPTSFNPDRFLSENTADKHPFSYVPFSAGSRNCIGQKYAMLVVKIILIKILEAYELSTTMRSTDLKMYAELVLINEGGIKISLEERKHSANA
ncbi:unnamed protein product [Bemisia tabaci]|uniref:Cytochrome P450 n=1 Tax=Bemisia tabaci TaxID=7038 RepID=A0A9N9ZYD3_BEMTA|nr:unnamed protein product [Bemisia tabaci]